MLQQIIQPLIRQASLRESKIIKKYILLYGVINRQVVGATGCTTINYHTTISKVLFCNNIQLKTVSNN